MSWNECLLREHLKEHITAWYILNLTDCSGELSLKQIGAYLLEDQNFNKANYVILNVENGTNREKKTYAPEK